MQGRSKIRPSVRTPTNVTLKMCSPVFRAVYIDKHGLKCACVCGSSNVPLGFISLTENLMMIAMAVWMALAAVGRMTGGIHTMN